MTTATPGLYRAAIDLSAFTTDTTVIAAQSGRSIYVRALVLSSPGAGGKLTFWDGASSGTLKLAAFSPGTQPIILGNPMTGEPDPAWFFTSFGNALVATQASSVALYGHIIYSVR
jgi:hypothetical protein